MKKSLADWKLIGGILLAYTLILFSFESKPVFWYIYTASILFLISITISTEKIDDELSTKQYTLLGVFSGIGLYLLFWAGAKILTYVPIFHSQVEQLYDRFSLESAWHYLVLIFIIIPGEEIFWRGFILKRLLRNMESTTAIITAAVINGLAYISTGYYLLIVAAFVSGVIWGIFYTWKRSIPLLIVSHLIFDLLLFILLPLD